MSEEDKNRAVVVDHHHQYQHEQLPPPPPQYGTFQGVANYPPPPVIGFPQPVPPPGAAEPSGPYYPHGYQTVQGTHLNSIQIDLLPYFCGTTTLNDVLNIIDIKF